MNFDKYPCDVCPEMAIWFRIHQDGLRCAKHKPLNTEDWLCNLNGGLLAPEQVLVNLQTKYV